MVVETLQDNNMSINFIAEVSSNHSKDLARSLDFIDSAAEIGCDSVKFQLFKINNHHAQHQPYKAALELIRLH